MSCTHTQNTETSEGCINSHTERQQLFVRRSSLFASYAIGITCFNTSYSSLCCDVLPRPVFELFSHWPTFKLLPGTGRELLSRSTCSLRDVDRRNCAFFSSPIGRALTNHQSHEGPSSGSGASIEGSGMGEDTDCRTQI